MGRAAQRWWNLQKTAASGPGHPGPLEGHKIRAVRLAADLLCDKMEASHSATSFT